MRVRRDFKFIKSSSERVNNTFEPTFQFGIYLPKVCGIPNKSNFFQGEKKVADKDLSLRDGRMSN